MNGFYNLPLHRWLSFSVPCSLFTTGLSDGTFLDARYQLPKYCSKQSNHQVPVTVTTFLHKILRCCKEWKRKSSSKAIQCSSEIKPLVDLSLNKKKKGDESILTLLHFYIQKIYILYREMWPLNF